MKTRKDELQDLFLAVKKTFIVLWQKLINLYIYCNKVY